MDLIVLVIFYLSMKYGENIAALFAFVQGLFVDIYSVGIYGLSPFLYLCVCLMICVLSSLIDIHRKIGNMIAISLVMFTKTILFIFIVGLIFKNVSFGLSLFTSELQYITLTVFISPIIFKLLNRLQ